MRLWIRRLKLYDEEITVLSEFKLMLWQKNLLTSHWVCYRSVQLHNLGADVSVACLRMLLLLELISDTQRFSLLKLRICFASIFFCKWLNNSWVSRYFIMLAVPALFLIQKAVIQSLLIRMVQFSRGFYFFSSLYHTHRLMHIQINASTHEHIHTHKKTERKRELLLQA